MSTPPDWREADLHDLRLRYAAILSDISNHRWRTSRVRQPCGHDHDLWSVLVGTGFDGPVAEQADAPDSNSGPAMGAGSSPAGATLSDYESLRRLRSAVRLHRSRITSANEELWSVI